MPDSYCVGVPHICWPGKRPAASVSPSSKPCVFGGSPVGNTESAEDLGIPNPVHPCMRINTGARLATDTLGQTLKFGAYASLTKKGWQAVVQLGASIALARLLVPEDFGVAAAAAAFSGAFQVLGDLGLGAYLIQSRTFGNSHFKQLFTLNMIMSCLLGGGIFLLGPVAAVLFGDPRVCNVVRVLAFLAPARALSSMHEKVLRRRLHFRITAVLAGLRLLLTCLAQVGMAVLGYGYWSLVVPQVLVVALFAPLYWMAADCGPRLEWPQIRDLAATGALKYGVSATGNAILVFFLNNGDYFVTGKLLGSEALGLYTFSFTKANKFGNLILSSVQEVTLPGFSAVNEDWPRLWRGFKKSVITTTLLSMPVSMYLLGIAPVMIPMVFGESWEKAIKPFQLLCVFASINALTSPIDSVAYAVGKPQIVMRVHAWLVPCLLLACGIGARVEGVLGVAVAVVAVRGLGSIVRAFRVASLLSPKPFSLARSLLPSVLSSAGAGLVGWLTVEAALTCGVQGIVVVMVAAAAYAASFMLFARCWDRENMRTFFDAVMDKHTLPRPLRYAIRMWIP